MAGVICPMDRQDKRIQLVSLIVESARETGRYYYENYDTKTSEYPYEKIAGSRLNMLEEPLEQLRFWDTKLLSGLVPFSRRTALVYFVFLAGSAISSCMLTAATSIASYLVFAASVVITIAVLAGLFVVIGRQNAKNALGLARWNRAYYCAKHNIVFDPETGDYAPLGEIKAFLARAGKAQTALS